MKIDIATQIITTASGDQLVVLSRRDYDMLLARLGDEEAGDRASVWLIDDAKGRLERGEDLVLPDEIWAQIEGGMHPVEAIRRYRGLSRTQLARDAGIARSVLSAIETRERTASGPVLALIADALRAPFHMVAE